MNRICYVGWFADGTQAALHANDMIGAPVPGERNLTIVDIVGFQFQQVATFGTTSEEGYLMILARVEETAS